MTPVFSANDGAYVALTKPKARSDFSMRHAESKRSDFSDLINRQASHPVALAFCKHAMANSVGGVVRVSSPSKIARHVIQAVPVVVAHLMLWRWAWAIEGRANKSVNKVVFPARRVPQTDESPSSIDSRVPLQQPTRAAHSAEAADLVGPSLDGPPFFGRIRGIGLVSHGDLQLGRGGQGPVRASNSPGPANIAQNPAPKRESRHPKATASDVCHKPQETYGWRRSLAKAPGWCDRSQPWQVRRKFYHTRPAGPAGNEGVA